jgi:hypothetical protein
MECVILLHFSGSFNEQFELVGMRPHMFTFQKTPSFNELVARIRVVINVECDLRLHGRYDMGGILTIKLNTMHVGDTWTMI